MSSIDWASATSGTWSVGADWAGGVAPGADDDAVINAKSQYGFDRYGVAILSPVTVRSLTIASKNAVVDATSGLTAGAISLSAGTLEASSAIAANLTISGGVLTLDPGSSYAGTLVSDGGTTRFAGANVTGSVDWNGGTLRLLGQTVFDNVVWHGDLTSTTGGALVVQGGLTLTDTAGTGPGQASVRKLTLNQVSTLDDATISLTGTRTNVTVQNSPTLTLGSKLTLQNAQIAITGGDTLVNDGTIAGGSVIGGTFINNGQITGSFTDIARKSTNNGTITVTAGDVLALHTPSSLAVGANSAIMLSGGNLLLTGDFTTLYLPYLYATDHIMTTAQSGFGLNGVLNNSHNQTLVIGTGTQLGTLYSGAHMTIMAGSVVDHGGTEGATLTLDNVTYDEDAASANFGIATLIRTTFQGASTVNAQSLNLHDATFSTATTFNIGSSLTLNNVVVGTAANPDAAIVNFNADSGYTALTIASQQSLTGFSFSFGSAGTDASHTVLFDVDDSVDNTRFVFNGFSNTLESRGGTVSVVLGQNVGIEVDTGALTVLGQFSNDGSFAVTGQLDLGLSEGAISRAATLLNAGQITIGSASTLFIDPAYGTLTNTGTIAVNGGTLEASVTDLINQGALSVNNGTLVLDGALATTDLSRFAHPGSEVIDNGTLSLGGQNVTLGSAALENFTLSNSITDGTLTIGAGSTLTAAGYGSSLDATIKTALVNGGTIAVTGGSGGADAETLVLGTNVTGNGRIVLGAAASDSSEFVTVKLDGAVSAGQTLSFLNGYDTLEFGNLSAAHQFAGTITNLANAIEPSFQFDSATIKSASIVGETIHVLFSGNGTATLATDTALTGSLSFYESQGNAILSYSHS